MLTQCPPIQIFCQIINQTFLNLNTVNASRGWALFCLCLSCFAPSKDLVPYLLCQCSRHAIEGFKALGQHKLLRIRDMEPRLYPPTFLEHTAALATCEMAVEIEVPGQRDPQVRLDMQHVF